MIGIFCFRGQFRFDGIHLLVGESLQWVISGSFALPGREGHDDTDIRMLEGIHAFATLALTARFGPFLPAIEHPGKLEGQGIFAYAFGSLKKVCVRNLARCDGLLQERLDPLLPYDSVPAHC